MSPSPATPLPPNLAAMLREHLGVGDRAGLQDLLRQAGGADRLWTGLAQLLSAQQRRLDHTRTLLANLPDGHWDWDIARDSVSCSARCRAMLGLPPGESAVPRANLVALVHADDLAPVRERLVAHLSQRSEQFEAELRVPRSDGQWCWLMCRGRVVSRDPAGRALRMVGSTSEISARKQAAEDLLAAKEQAESAGRARTDFLARISHEIRTPMNAIIGMTDLALQTKLDAEQQNYLRNVKSAGENLLGIINDLLDFSRVDAGRIEIEQVEFSIRGLIEDTVRVLAPQAHRRGLELLVSVAEGVPDRLTGDPLRVRQILTNLLGNAIKFTERGEIEIGARIARPTDTSLFVQFWVRDTGIGVPAEKHRAIFEAFSQAERSTTRKFGGSGLGLAICQKLVHLMDGQIWLESEAGQGSTFHFTVRFSDARPALSVSPDAHRLRGVRALVADNHPATAQRLGALLADWGVRVDVVGGGQAALAALAGAAQANDPYGLLILDGHMASPSGFEVAAKFQDAAPQLERIIMLVHADSLRADTERCRHLRVNLPVVKPVSPSGLFDAVAIAVGLDRESEYDIDPFELDAQVEAAGGRESYDVLLVEDNPINQTVGVKLLERAGHRVEIAANGQEALEWFERKRFDVILMDMEMPVMDGVEATEAIRGREMRRTWAHTHGWHQTPIIAMTAHALQGDRERYLQAGMDDYVAKPIRADELLGAIARAVGRAAEPQFDSLPLNAGAAPANTVANLAELRELLDGDEQVLQRMIEMFLADYGKQLEALSRALEAGDAGRIATLAHALKGQVGAFYAASAREAVGHLEAAARGGALADARGQFGAVFDATQRLAEALRAEGERLGAMSS